MNRFSMKDFEFDRPIMVIGSGGHAKVLISVLQIHRASIIGITDSNSALKGQSVLGVPIQGEDELILNHDPQKVYLVNGVGSVSSPQTRSRIFERWVNSGYRFATVIHPFTSIAQDVQLGQGCQIMAGSVVQTGTSIGANTIVNTRASIDHDCQIGDSCHIAPGVVLSGSVRIGSLSHIGTGASIIQGITVGRNAIVGAGAAVIRDVLSDDHVAGVPARSIRKISTH